MRRRTKAREIALQFLYQRDLRGEEVMETMGEFIASETVEKEVREFATRLTLGAIRWMAETDQRLRDVTRNWDLSRMATVDRNILRMAVFELLHCLDIPPKVTINEAIEIGKKFSTANSGAFINGILDRIRIDALKTEEAGSSTDSSSGIGQDS